MHQPVLNSVVHHLRVVARPNRAGVDESIRHITSRPQRIENGHQPGDVGVATTDHQAVALGETPDATGYTGVDESNPALPE